MPTSAVVQLVDVGLDPKNIHDATAGSTRHEPPVANNQSPRLGQARRGPREARRVYHASRFVPPDQHLKFSTSNSRYFVLLDSQSL